MALVLPLPYTMSEDIIVFCTDYRSNSWQFTNRLNGAMTTSLPPAEMQAREMMFNRCLDRDHTTTPSMRSTSIVGALLFIVAILLIIAFILFNSNVINVAFGAPVAFLIAGGVLIIVALMTLQSVNAQRMNKIRLNLTEAVNELNGRDKLQNGWTWKWMEDTRRFSTYSHRYSSYHYARRSVSRTTRYEYSFTITVAISQSQRNEALRTSSYNPVSIPVSPQQPFAQPPQNYQPPAYQSHPYQAPSPQGYPPQVYPPQDYQVQNAQPVYGYAPQGAPNQASAPPQQGYKPQQYNAFEYN